MHLSAGRCYDGPDNGQSDRQPGKGTRGKWLFLLQRGRPGAFGLTRNLERNEPRKEIITNPDLQTKAPGILF